MIYFSVDISKTNIDHSYSSDQNKFDFLFGNMEKDKSSLDYLVTYSEDGLEILEFS